MLVAGGNRASLDSSGNEANAASSAPAISADGRHVAFSSSASNLVAGDTNGVADIYRHDTLTSETIRVSVNSSGDEANGASSAAAVSADGRYVAFQSDASNLVGGDTNGIADVFVHDTVSGATTRVSVDSAGNQAVASGWSVPLSAAPDISADGRVVTFASTASNLVTGDTNDLPDVFVHDTLSGATTRVSVDSAGNQVTCPLLPAPEFCEEFQIGSVAPSVSADGRQIAFASSGVGLLPDGASRLDPEVFVHDTSTGTTQWVSLDGLGNQAWGTSSAPALSDDGLYIGFTSTASNLVEGDTGRTDVFVRAVTQPVVDTVTPSSVARATTTTVTVTGAGFGPGTTVSTFVTNPNGVTIDSVTVVSTTELELEVTVDPTAATGTRNLFLTVPGPGPGDQGITASHGNCNSCLTVT